MTPQASVVAVGSGGDADRGLRRGWTVIAALLLAAVFAQAVLAGAMLSGFAWARAAHSAGASLLIIVTLAAVLAAVFNLRRIP